VYEIKQNKINNKYGPFLAKRRKGRGGDRKKRGKKQSYVKYTGYQRLSAMPMVSNNVIFIGQTD
jgi:hypothetical protein